MMKMQTLCVSCLVSVLVAGTSTAWGVTINGDINGNSARTFTGTGAAGGGTWNGLQPSGAGPSSVSGTDLLASDNSPTAVDFSATGAGNFGDIGTSDPNTLNPLLDDYMFTDGGTFAVGTFQFKDLGAGTTWDVYLYGTAGNYNQRSIFTITGYGSQGESFGSSSATTTTVPVGDLNLTYVKFSNVVAGAGNGGEINGSWTNNPSFFAGPFNGFQLVSVPEPNSLITLGLGVLGLMRFVRRRRS